MDINGEYIYNDYDCPILSLTNLVYCISSEHILQSVSIIHECTTTCVFVTKSVSKRVEHEDVNTSSLAYDHDWSNKLFCHNVYCMYHT